MNFVKIYFFELPTRKIPRAIFYMGFHHLQLKRFPGIAFYKLLGTGKGETFTPKDANSHRWGLLVVGDEAALSNFDTSSVIRAWRRISHHEYHALLRPLASHGKWSRREPFLADAKEWDGQVAAITRARIKWSKNARFWRSVPPVTLSLHSSPGLRSAIGIGEAPLGLQGTYSTWSSSQELRKFAYQSAPHLEVIDKTKEIGWYAEELFARFAIIEERGSL